MVDIPKDVRSEATSEAKRVEAQDPLATSPSLAIRSDTTSTKTRRHTTPKTTPEITRATKDIKKSEDKLDHDIAHLSTDKIHLLEQTKILEDLYQKAQASGLSKATVRRLGSLLIEAQDKLKMLSGVMPESAVSRDRTVMEEILKKWHEYDYARTHQAIAEGKFHKNPEDKRAEGDVNRARATAYALNEEINTLVKQSEERISSETPNPALDEGLSIKQPATPVVVEVPAVAPEAPTVPALPAEQPKESAPATQTIVEKSTAQTTILPELSIDQEESLSYTHKQVVADDNIRKTKRPTGPIAYTLPKRESPAGQQNEGVAPKESTPATVTEIAPSQPPQATKTLLEITASNPQAIEYASTQVRKHLDTLFGKKGFMGMGSEEGIKSRHWSDPTVGFSKKAVEEILEIEPDTAVDSKNLFGSENREAVEKMQDYLMFTLTETGVHPEPGEKAEEYLKRAATVTIDKFIDSKNSFAQTPTPIPPAEKNIVAASIEAPAQPEVVNPEPVITQDIHPLIEEAPTQPAPEPIVPEVVVPASSTEEVVVTTAIQDAIPMATPEPPISHEEPVAEPAQKIEAQAEQAQSIFATMPQQFTPNNPQVLAYADTEVTKHLDILFGSKGVLGFGAKRGIQSLDWSDPVNGFANKTVAAVMEAEPEATPVPGTPNIGIRNQLATSKAQDYIMLAMSETGVHPEPEEKTEDYLKRAAAITIDKYIQKEGKPPQI